MIRENASLEELKEYLDRVYRAINHPNLMVTAKDEHAQKLIADIRKRISELEKKNAKVG